MLAVLLLAALPAADAPAPLALHPDNPHYFLWRGKAAVLVTSGEHYGAVLNLDFDYKTYLKALEADGLNLTRTFSGAYVEPAGAFNIAENTLAPAKGRFICPVGNDPWVCREQEATGAFSVGRHDIRAGPCGNREHCTLRELRPMLPAGGDEFPQVGLVRATGVAAGEADSRPKMGPCRRRYRLDRRCDA